MQCKDCLELLDAYIDDELSSDNRAAVGAHLSECASCSRALEAVTANSRRIQEGLVHYTAPEVLRARVRGLITDADGGSPGAAGAPRRVPGWTRVLGAVAAAGIVAAASSAITLAVANRQAAARAEANALLASHVRSLMPGHLVDVASTNQHNVKPWFDGRVDLSPPVPALDSAGFVLAGGRLDYVAGHPAAVVVYMRRQHVINVYSWPARADDRPTGDRALQGYHFLSWQANGIAFRAASDLNEAELSAFVALYQRAAEGAAR